MNLWLVTIGGDEVYIVAPDGTSLDAIEIKARELYSTKEGFTQGSMRDGARAYFGGIARVRNLVGVIHD